MRERHHQGRGVQDEARCSWKGSLAEALAAREAAEFGTARPGPAPPPPSPAWTPMWSATQRPEKRQEAQSQTQNTTGWGRNVPQLRCRADSGQTAGRAGPSLGHRQRQTLSPTGGCGRAPPSTPLPKPDIRAPSSSPRLPHTLEPGASLPSPTPPPTLPGPGLITSLLG